ncbi:MAG: extracellular solute-binding protein [Clostridia bacterium]|nr:extracellular solute-binding protein [Clostridia bacterium]
MRKLKVIFLLLAILLQSLVLSSCHVGRDKLKPFSVPESLDSDTQYEITFWAKNESNEHQRAVYLSAIEEFEALYPNIKVNCKMYTDYGRIYSDVITNIQTATTPDVCITYPDHIATYITGPNIVVPLDTLIADERYGLGGSDLRFDGVSAGGIVGKFLDEGKIGGVQYALPFMRSTEACYINRDLVEALGYTLPEDGLLTWDFVFEVSRAAMVKDENGKYINGQTTMIPFIYKSTDNMMIQMLRQKGADYSTDYGEIKVFNEDTEQILCMVGDISADRAFNTFKRVSYPGNYLNRGQCIFAIDSTAGATWMGSDAPNLDVSADEIVGFETVVTPVPQFDTENPKMISQGPSVCIFNKEDPGRVLASWLFAQYLLTDGVQIAYSKTEGYIPVTTEAQESSEYLEYLASAGQESSAEDAWIYHGTKHAATRLLLDNIENTFTTPVFNGSTSLRNAAGQMIEDVVLSARRGEEIDGEYISNLYDKVTSLYKLDQFSASGSERQLGELPALSIGLLVGLALVWVGISIYFLTVKRRIFKNTREKK